MCVCRVVGGSARLTGAQYGVKDKCVAFLRSAVQCLWNAVLPLTGTAAGRSMLLGAPLLAVRAVAMRSLKGEAAPVTAVLERLATLADNPDAAVVAELYYLQLDCLRDAGQWKRGLECLDVRARPVVPSGI
jgi:hypothetical protein